MLSPKVIDLIEDDSTIWERKPLENLATSGQLQAFTHNGFWQPMDTPTFRRLKPLPQESSFKLGQAMSEMI